MKKTTVMFWRNFGLTSLDVVNLLNWSVAMVRCFVCIDWIFWDTPWFLDPRELLSQFRLGKRSHTQPTPQTSWGGVLVNKCLFHIATNCWTLNSFHCVCEVGWLVECFLLLLLFFPQDPALIALLSSAMALPIKGGATPASAGELVTEKSVCISVPSLLSFWIGVCLLFCGCCRCRGIFFCWFG